MKPYLRYGALALALWAPGQALANDEVLAEALIDYMDFAPYEAGMIMPVQLTPDLMADITFVDVRKAEEFAAGSVDGAINMEWREVPSRLEELPQTGLVVMLCNTGSLSAQATLAARLLGRDNVLALHGGIDGWTAR